MGDQQEDRSETDSEDRPTQKNNDDDSKQDKSGKNKSKPDGDDDKDDKDEHKPHSKWPIIIAIAVAVVLIIAGIIYWIATMGEVSTDDAYTDGDAVSIAANVSGYVTRLNISDNTYVHAGEILLAIDPREDEASLTQAQANVAVAQSQLVSAEANLTQMQVKGPAQLQEAKADLAQAEAQEEQTRRNDLREHEADERATTATDVDQATEQLRAAQANTAKAEAEVAAADLIPQILQTAVAQVQQARAQVAQSNANLLQAQVKLSYNEIAAPQDGWITMRSVDLGTYVQAGQQIFYIVTPNVWITANFKETQLAHMKPGQRVTMTVDQFPSLTLHGHVESIQQGSGARFSAFPAENATGNFVKIVRRVPVKIIVDTGMPPNLHSLPLGISVEPTVHEP